MKNYFLLGVLAMTMTAAASPLPEYVVFDPVKDHYAPEILRLIAAPISFPLNTGDEEDIGLLTDKFDLEENCAGLAAPQIGISKRVIIFSVPDGDAELKKRRPDLLQAMPKTVWINPKYEGVEAFGYNDDYEACFSVKDSIGPVSRYKKIHYEAYGSNGQPIKGEAEGFLARLIQHEIDHLNGILWTDKVDLSKVMRLDEYRRIRKLQEEQKLTNNENYADLRPQLNRDAKIKQE